MKHIYSLVASILLLLFTHSLNASIISDEDAKQLHKISEPLYVKQSSISPSGDWQLIYYYWRIPIAKGNHFKDRFKVKIINSEKVYSIGLYALKNLKTDKLHFIDKEKNPFSVRDLNWQWSPDGKHVHVGNWKSYISIYEVSTFPSSLVQAKAKMSYAWGLDKGNDEIAIGAGVHHAPNIVFWKDNTNLYSASLPVSAPDVFDGGRVMEHDVENNKVTIYSKTTSIDKKAEAVDLENKKALYDKYFNFKSNTGVSVPTLEINDTIKYPDEFVASPLAKEKMIQFKRAYKIYKDHHK